MPPILELPLYIFHAISEYICTFILSEDKRTKKESFKSWRNLCNSSKLLHEVKQSLTVYDLNLVHSVAYLTQREAKNILFPERYYKIDAILMKRVVDNINVMFKQILLDLKYFIDQKSFLIPQLFILYN
jgi:hypothetical protein